MVVEKLGVRDEVFKELISLDKEKQIDLETLLFTYAYLNGRTEYKDSIKELERLYFEKSAPRQYVEGLYKQINMLILRILARNMSFAGYKVALENLVILAAQLDEVPHAKYNGDIAPLFVEAKKNFLQDKDINNLINGEQGIDFLQDLVAGQRKSSMAFLREYEKMEDEKIREYTEFLPSSIHGAKSYLVDEFDRVFDDLENISRLMSSIGTRYGNLRTAIKKGDRAKVKVLANLLREQMEVVDELKLSPYVGSLIALFFPKKKMSYADLEEIFGPSAENRQSIFTDIIRHSIEFEKRKSREIKLWAMSILKKWFLVAKMERNIDMDVTIDEMLRLDNTLDKKHSVSK